MSLPSLPAFFNMTFSDKSGNMTRDSLSYFDQQFQVLNTLLKTINTLIYTTIESNGDFKINYTSVGSLNNTKISDHEFLNSVPIGSLWYNTDIDKMQFLGFSGGLKVVQTITSV